MILPKWVQGLPVKGFAVAPAGIQIESLQQFLAQFTPEELATCPTALLPTFEFGDIQWPDVCHCPANGGATFELHELQAPCTFRYGSEEFCNCTGATHIEGCPFDVCPIAQCHPLCYQVLGHGEDIYCHCPCHG